MAETITKCPHCGFESEDDEMCRACGALFEDIPVRDISFAQVVGGIFSWLKKKKAKGFEVEGDPFLPDFDNDPAFVDIPGGSMYLYYHGDEDLKLPKH